MFSLFRFIKAIFSYLFKLINYARLLVFNLLFVAIIAMVYFSYTVQEEKRTVADNSYIHIKLDGYLVEQRSPADIQQEITNQLSGINGDTVQEFDVRNVIKVINYAQVDPKIKGIVLDLSGLRSGNLNQLSAIGKSLEAFKEDNKKVLAYSGNYTQSQYYLASYADEITLAPNGAVFLQGYAVNRLYYKDFLESLLITPHIFKVGTYKSFVEPFTENEMSTNSKQANRHWLNQLWKNYIETVLTQRKDISTLSEKSINPTLAELKKGLKEASGDPSEYAQSVGLVDHLAFYDDFINDLNENTGNDYKHISYQNYLAKLPIEFDVSTNKVALIYGVGDIVTGQGDVNSLSDKRFSHLLKRALRDPQVKAVVLRLDTPGGSAFASENIRQQVLALKKAGKKVIVSMGAVTASGGYWIASAADKIIASPTTLTGSIGIFGLFATVDKSLNKLGIYQDGVATNELANIGLTNPLKSELAELFQIGIENGYDNFLKVVAEGRDMNINDVDKIAQGRVWTGIDALNNGLVDELGDLDDAIYSAVQLASLENYDVKVIKHEMSPQQAIINELFFSVSSYIPQLTTQSTLVTSLLDKFESQVSFIEKLNDPQNRFVYCIACSIE